MSQPEPAYSHIAYHSGPHAQAAETEAQLSQTAEEKAEEARRIRRLQFLMNTVMQLIERNRKMPVEQASVLVANARRTALAMFPDKAQAFDLLFWPQLQRTMRQRYRMQ